MPESRQLGAERDAAIAVAHTAIELLEQIADRGAMFVALRLEYARET